MFAIINVQINSLNQRTSNSSSKNIKMNNHTSRISSDTDSESNMGSYTEKAGTIGLCSTYKAHHINKMSEGLSSQP